jgi:putative transposase
LPLNYIIAKELVLWLFTKEGRISSGSRTSFELIETRYFFRTKLDYILLNPARAGIVAKEEEYLYSSCADLYGIRKGCLELEAFED